MPTQAEMTLTIGSESAPIQAMWLQIRERW